MSKKIMKLLGILVLVCIIFINKANADTIELKDDAKINSNTIVTNYNGADIYFETKKIEIENFETIVDGKNTYRKYVSLDDLINVIPSISYNSNTDSNIISINRKYDTKINGQDVYYDTEHDISKKTYTSVLFVGEDDKILFGDSTRDEVITADVDTLKFNNKIYVSLRFVTEALGAEVTHKILTDEEMESNKKNEKVSIDFYSSKNYLKLIELELKNESNEIVTVNNIESSNSDSCFYPNFSYKYRETGNSELKSINNTYVKIYSDNNFSWNINDKKLCSKTDSVKTLENTTVVIKYRGVPVIVDMNNLGILNYCKVENLTLEENCDTMMCSENPMCGIVQGEYYCCNENLIFN